ncbi:MAG: hypothetical protein WBA23_13040 [Tunicatimonas sp.]|uniref:hypothetical protein n=1 Tax=Tunicatimonas sp. TaxID=1940096 RepID=UPI003C7402B6
MVQKQILVIILVVAVIVISSCQRDIVCWGTAETLQFSLVDPAGAPIITTTDTNAVVVTYLSINNSVSTVPDICIAETINQGLFSISSAEMVDLAHQDSSLLFTLNYDGQTLGEISLDTYEDNTGCDPWYVTSALLFNGNSVEQNSIGIYLIEISR